MIKDLAKLATRLDRLGLTKEADVLDSALQKLAQEVATTGVEGATYSTGRQLTPGFAGGPTVKFYKARPKSISEFNAFLGALISNAAADPRQTAFSSSVVKNLPSKSDTTWGRKTQAAFKEYAAAAGFPDAGVNWESFAKKSGKYEPTMNGIFRFWEDTIAKVDYDVALTQTLEGNMVAESKTPTVDPYDSRDGKGIKLTDTRRPSYDPMDPLADLNLPSPESPSAAGASGPAPFNEGPLKRRVYSNITGGSGIQIGAEGQKFFSTYTGQIMDKIRQAVSMGPVEAAWFSQNPDTVFPDKALKENNFKGIYFGDNQNIKDVYEFIQNSIQHIDKAKKSRSTR